MAAAVLLVAAIAAWAIDDWSVRTSNHLEHLRRYAHGLLVAVDLTFRDRSPDRSALEEQLRRVAEQAPDGAPPVLWVLVQAPTGARVAAAGEPPGALQVDAPVGSRLLDDALVVWRPVRLPVPAGPSALPPALLGGPRPPGSGPAGWQGPPLLDRPAWEPQAAWSDPSHPDVPLLGTPLAAIAIARAMPEATLRAQLSELLLPVGLALLATFAVTAAWALGIRGRQTLVALDVERARRAHLEELGLAAAGLAHEAKNPLGIILGLAQRIAKSPADPARTAEAAEQIVDAADRASARLGEFIHYARIRDPSLEALRGPTVVERVASVLRGDFEAAGVELDARSEELTIRADEDLLLQALVNLLLNALHATEAGGRVSVTLEAHGRRARLVVEDNGRGIPQGLLADVLKPYVTGRAGGHGLGLAVVKRVADQHGWSVDVWSREGEGSRFVLSGIPRVEEQA